uniref:Uncharacterized protein n=1 Tax=Anguilla anguilla TaxID=7936 RepID=A0A0E9RYC5_ANGAN
MGLRGKKRQRGIERVMKRNGLISECKVQRGAGQVTVCVRVCVCVCSPEAEVTRSPSP